MDLVDYMNELRESILEGYTGIIQGLNSNQEFGKVRVFFPHYMWYVKVTKWDMVFCYAPSIHYRIHYLSKTM